MRIALVTPHVATILGNRGAFVLARALAEEHEVTVVVDALSTKLAAEVAAFLRPARLEALRTAELPPVRMSRLLWRQVVRGPDRRIARRLREIHEQHPLDVIFVRSDEGHWIGEYVRRWPVAQRPTTLLGVLDLLDHPFLLRYERPHPTLRGLTAVAYPWLHELEDRRLRSFDGLVANSSWTSELLAYLYGLPVLGEVDAYDDRQFGPAMEPPVSGGYLAVPTASLDPATTQWVERLHADGIPLRLYGPRSAGTVPTLGFLSSPAMADLLRGANATLFLFDYEAFGLIPVESLALGTPVITMPKGGPFAELRGNPDVRFVSTYEETLAACRDALGRTKSPATVATCHASVARFRPSAAAAALLAAIDRARAVRAPSRNGA